MKIILLFLFSLTHIEYSTADLSQLVSLAPPFFRAVSGIQSNNTSVADSAILSILHDLTSDDVDSLAQLAFKAINSGALDLYDAFNDTEKLANVLQNQIGSNSNKNLTLLLEKITRLSYDIMDTITQAAIITIEFGLDFKTGVQTLKFVKSHSNELDIQTQYVTAVAKDVKELESLMITLSKYITKLADCINKVEKTYKGKIQFIESPKREIKKINKILVQLKGDYNSLEKDLAEISKKFEEHVINAGSNPSVIVSLEKLIIAFGGASFNALESVINLFGNCQELKNYVTALVDQIKA